MRGPPTDSANADSNARCTDHALQLWVGRQERPPASIRQHRLGEPTRDGVQRGEPLNQPQLTFSAEAHPAHAALRTCRCSASFTTTIRQSSAIAMNIERRFSAC